MMRGEINLHEFYETTMRVIRGIDLTLIPSSITRAVCRRQTEGRKSPGDNYFVTEHILAAVGEIARTVAYWELARHLSQ